MLNINKILSKKIKFPLSLRGAKRRSNLSGFSLIELMVAVVILVMAIFGIFHAYSVGFMGMADARARTVATNYARQAMEDIKNMDFEKIITTSEVFETPNKEYRVDVFVSLEEPEIENLKKVLTVVSWKDRNGTSKTVETTMLVNFTEVYPSDAVKIVLFADSYTILNNDTTELTAIIKDIKGNTVIDWNVGDITFSILFGGEFGILSPITVTPDNGIARTTFSSGGYLSGGGIGNTVIKASVNLPIIGNVSDEVTIKVTDGPVKIVLEANPKIIKANNFSTIIVSLCDAAGVPVTKSDLGTDEVEINFIKFGEGILPTPDFTITFFTNDPGDAIADFSLDSTGTPGLASVVATTDNLVLESGTADVRFLGPPVSISISADPNPIYEDDDFSTIYVSLLDINGYKTNPDTITGTKITILLALDPDSNAEIKEDSSLEFDPSDGEGIILTRELWKPFSLAKEVISASGGELIGNSVTVGILSALVPDHIKLTANPQIVQQAGGTSTITATVYDKSGKTVSNYAGTIIFHIVPDTSSSYDIHISTTNEEAFTELSFIEPGTATITAVSSLDGLENPLESLESIVVGFYGVADRITLTANPDYLKAGEGDISTITATVCDSKLITVTNYTGEIYFSKTGVGAFISDDLVVDITNGIATIEIYSEEIGFAYIDATSTGLISGNVEVEFYKEATLILVENVNSPTYDSTNKVVTFDVEVSVDSIELDQMKVAWSESDPSERLFKIRIKIKNDEDASYVEVYNGNAKSGILVDTIITLESNMVYTIELTFGHDMAERHIDVMFYPQDEGWHLIRFVVPLGTP